jgi:hypothetical protein
MIATVVCGYRVKKRRCLVGATAVSPTQYLSVEASVFVLKGVF